MSRLFTFGCSYTAYGWPTWADICGRTFDTYVNYGRSGAGNHYIASSLLECDRVYNLTPEDTVLIMFSGSTRFDTLSYGGWGTRGNIFTTNGFFDDKFLQEYWSVDYGYQATWMHINHVHLFLEYKNIPHKIMTAFNMLPGFEAEYDYIPEITSKKFSIELEKDVTRILDVSIAMRDWVKSKYTKSDFYCFEPLKNVSWMKQGESFIDGHPTIKMHYDWVKQFLPNYLPEEFDVQKETEIHYNKMSYSPNYRRTPCACCVNNTGEISEVHKLWNN